MATTDPDPEAHPNLRALFNEMQQIGMSQADMADEQEAEDRRQALRDRVCTIGELVWKETEQAEPLLGPLVRRGMTTVIGGYGGAGKSTMALEFVKAIVTGGEFLGWDGPGGTAFIIDLEQGLSVAQRRVYEAFTGRSSHGINLRDEMDKMKVVDNEWQDVLYADWQEGVDLSNPGPALDVVREQIDATRPDVVMIDPVYKLFMGTDLNEQVGISAFVQQIQRMRTEYGFALILPMHPRKPGINPTGLTMHDLYGSAVWSWWAEQIVMLRRPASNPLQSILSFEKDRIGDGPPPGTRWTLEFERGDGYRRSDGESGSDKNPVGVHKVYQWLQEPGRAHKWWTRQDVAKGVGLAETTVKKHLEAIRKNNNQGRYPGFAVDKHGAWNVYAYKPGETEMLERPALPDEEDAW